MKCPPWWGYGYFLELHIGHLCTKHNLQTSVEKRVPSFFNFPLLIYLKIKNPPWIRILIGLFHVLSALLPNWGARKSVGEGGGVFKGPSHLISTLPLLMRSFDCQPLRKRSKCWHNYFKTPQKKICKVTLWLSRNFRSSQYWPSENLKSVFVTFSIPYTPQKILSMGCDLKKFWPSLLPFRKFCQQCGSG